MINLALKAESEAESVERTLCRHVFAGRSTDLQFVEGGRRLFVVAPCHQVSFRAYNVTAKATSDRPPHSVAYVIMTYPIIGSLGQCRLGGSVSFGGGAFGLSKSAARRRPFPSLLGRRCPRTGTPPYPRATHVVPLLHRTFSDPRPGRTVAV